MLPGVCLSSNARAILGKVAERIVSLRGRGVRAGNVLLSSGGKLSWSTSKTSC